MRQPVEYKSREPLNSLTGIKSSLSELRSVVALTYLLYLSNNKKETISYSVDNGRNGICLKDEYLDYIKKYLSDKNVDSVISKNPLLTSQIESIYVGVTLMFGLGRVSFENSAMPMTKERTGGRRYPKTIDFASNIINLDLILEGLDNSTRVAFLKSWLNNNPFETNIELRVATFLNICIENNLFKLKNDGIDLFFQSEGIYLGLQKDDTVTLKSDEKVGPTRILNSMLNENLIPWLKVKSSEVSYNSECQFNYDAYSKIVSTSLDIKDIKVDKQTETIAESAESAYRETLKTNGDVDFITSLKTKPFLLLAGISGTGKSQKVQELAFMTCPKGELRENGSTTPGNYCLIEVKPNWHDSTELLGYYSALSGKYELTDFIRFTYKAICNPKVPFFLCLDEMNLAPVEQYFAEFLSVLETRKKTEEGILTQPLLSKDKFSNCELVKTVPVKREGYVVDGEEYEETSLYSEIDEEIIRYLKTNGLRLPDNLFVIGTVNMDDTTHQFSRKVIDRAFTIEMNGGKMEDMFSSESRLSLEYREKPVDLREFKSEFVRAYEVLEDSRYNRYHDIITERIPKMLGNSDGSADKNSINGILNETPFRVSYRVQNELILYLSVLISKAGFPDEIENLIGEATLAILLEKILPRVQGEQKQLETQEGKSNILKDLKEYVAKTFTPQVNEDGETTLPLYDKVMKKLSEMDNKLTGYYTNFF
ncbi:McrB family protein [Segatella bryantii]|uniref:Uncharacterized protein n=1 Tax=Segatella bryantii TaxID=77095 RepID=A0ABX4EJA5_SEGBR|nr:hypothetical protein [Segatella bryantii]OYP54280.1 hypothetical protein CIK91_09320 [Segatella bryantii]UKK82042.1 hypothetical protein L6474_13145 [Segatella bryantii]